jgi:D-amino-acid dehydrogenase
MLSWGIHFARSSTAKRYNSGRVSLAKLNQRGPESLALLGTLGVNVVLGEQLVVPYHDPAVAEEYLARLRPMADFGVPLPAGMLDGDELRRIMPALTDHVKAGYVVPNDRSIDPRVFVDSLIDALRSRGVTLIEHAPITAVGHAHRRVNSITTPKGTITFDEVMLSVGSGSRPLGKLFGLRIPVIPGQGYNVGLPVNAGVKNPVIFEEAHAVATPFEDRIRLGGTMEFDGDEPRFDQRRVDAILTSLRKYLNLEWDGAFDTWSGSRPMSPDGLPLMGRPREFDNLIVAAGHGMFGLSLTPSSAVALSELIIDGRSSIDLTDFNPDRFHVRK